MGIGRGWRWAVCAALGGSAACALAQPSPPCTFGSYPFVYAGWGVSTKIGEPFQADVMWTFDQKLADGTTIHAWSKTRAARDSQGRTRFERAQGCSRDEDGQLHIRMDVSVSDPVTKKTIFWNEGPPLLLNAKVAHVSDLPATHKAASSPTPAEQQAKVDRQMLAAEERGTTRVETHRVDLGTATVGGVTAVGSRDVTTIPAGEWGNAQKFSTMREHWQASALGTEVKAVFEDPRVGRSAFEFQNVSLNEPDPSLFEAPEGYTVKENKPAN